MNASDARVVSESATCAAGTKGDAVLLSVITATYQAERTLAELKHSLEQQDLTGIEWIVQDGGSTDGTRDVVQSSTLESVRFATAADDGIYDAFNRALERARGEYVLFLGADDRLASPHVLTEALEAVRGLTRRPDAVLCSVVNERGERFRSALGPRTLVLNTVHHQGVLYRRTLFDGYRYRTDSRVVADYELNLLLRLRGARVAYSDVVLAVCDSGGVSHTANEWRLYRDLHELRRRHLPALVSTILLVIGVANVARRRLRSAR